MRDHLVEALRSEEVFGVNDLHLLDDIVGDDLVALLGTLGACHFMADVVEGREEGRVLR